MPVFTHTEVPPLILTTSGGPSTTPAAGSARWPRSSTRPGRDPDSVDAAAVLEILAERGLFRVLTEGGPLSSAT